MAIYRNGTVCESDQPELILTGSRREKSLDFTYQTQNVDEALDDLR